MNVEGDDSAPAASPVFSLRRFPRPSPHLFAPFSATSLLLLAVTQKLRDGVSLARFAFLSASVTGAPLRLRANSFL